MDAKSSARCVLIYRKLLDGGKFTPKEMANYVDDKLGYMPTIRTIQRDLESLNKISELGVEYMQSGNSKSYYVSSGMRKSAHALNIQSADLLSMYILKAFLKTFKGTNVEDITSDLIKNLSKYAPNDVVSEEELLWDKNVGNYDYSEHVGIIDRIIVAINEKEWVRVEYETGGRYDTNIFDTCFRQFFTYAGFLYVIAYVPHHKKNIALAVQWIKDFKIINEHDYKLPKFNKQEFINTRFGVFSDEPEEIVIKINPGMGKYFVKRFWHETAIIANEADGTYLKMKAPVTHDLVAWIMSWTGSVEVIKPMKLKERIILKLESGLRLYKKSQASINN